MAQVGVGIAVKALHHDVVLGVLIGNRLDAVALQLQQAGVGADVFRSSLACDLIKIKVIHTNLLQIYNSHYN